MGTCVESVEDKGVPVRTLEDDMAYEDESETGTRLTDLEYRSTALIVFHDVILVINSNYLHHA